MKVSVTTTGKNNLTTRFVVDSGSDWNGLGPRHLSALGLKHKDLKPPTRQMANTRTANGTKMVCLGYAPGNFTFGSKTVTGDLVFFEGVENPLLSLETLLYLDIISLRLEPPTEVTAETEPRITTVQAAKSKPVTVTRPAKPSFEEVTREDLLREFSDVFEPRLDDMKGEKFAIVLEDGVKPTRISAPRFVAKERREPLRQEIQKLLDEGKIERCNKVTDSWHGLVLQRKKSGGVRVTIDLRDLNRYVQREGCHAPSVLDVCQEIHADEAAIFSTFDAYKGYNQIGLSESSKDLTAFLCPEGKFRWAVAPMGLSSISDHYNRRMTDALADVSNYVKIVDDNLVYSRNRRDHVRHVRTFLQACRDNRIHLSKEKFVFAQPEVEFAGTVVNASGYHQQERIFSAIRDFKQPETVSELRSFHGMAQQLAPYNAKLAQILAPLRPLLSPKNEFVFDAEKVQAFENAKKELCSKNVIAFYRPNQPMGLYVDASNKNGLGFCLKQKQPDGEWRPIQVGSRRLMDAETRYAPIELELTGLAWAIRKCRKFLTDVKFKVYTDHRPLVSICNKRRLDEVENRRLLNCLLKIVDFNFEVVWVPGSTNTTADCLSRSPVCDPDAEDADFVGTVSAMMSSARADAEEEAGCSVRMEALKQVADEDFEYQLLMQQIRMGFPDHKRQLELLLHPYWNVHNDLMISDDGFVLMGTRLVIPKGMRKRVLDDLHASHRGIEGTQQRARLVVYWPNIDQDIAQRCRACTMCQFDRPSNPREPIKHLPIPSRAYEILSADWFDCRGRKFLVITDWYTGWFSVRMVDGDRAEAAFVIRSIREVVCDGAAPDVLFSDQGPPFGSRDVQDFLRRWGVKWEPSSPEYPQSNCYAELAVKNAKGFVTKCWDGKKMDMDKWTEGMLQIRNTPHKSTGLSPAVLLF